MARDEQLVAVIEEAFRASLRQSRSDPEAVERVGQAVGAALGGGAVDLDAGDGPVPADRARPEDGQLDSAHR